MCHRCAIIDTLDEATQERFQKGEDAMFAALDAARGAAEKKYDEETVQERADLEVAQGIFNSATASARKDFQTALDNAEKAHVETRNRLWREVNEAAVAQGKEAPFSEEDFIDFT